MPEHRFATLIADETGATAIETRAAHFCPVSARDRVGSNTANAAITAPYIAPMCSDVPMVKVTPTAAAQRPHATCSNSAKPADSVGVVVISIILEARA